MWKIKHIFDGEYGCEELAEGQRPKVSVTLINEKEEETCFSVEDGWLTEHGLNEGRALRSLARNAYIRKLNFLHKTIIERLIEASHGYLVAICWRAIGQEHSGSIALHSL